MSIISRNLLNSLEAKFEVLFNLATCSNYSITNYVEIPVFHFFEKVNKGHLKMVNLNYFNKIIKEPGTCFQSPALSPKHVINVYHTAHQFLTKFHFDST